MNVMTGLFKSVWGRVTLLIGRHSKTEDKCDYVAEKDQTNVLKMGWKATVLKFPTKEKKKTPKKWLVFLRLQVKISTLTRDSKASFFETNSEIEVFDFTLSQIPEDEKSH